MNNPLLPSQMKCLHRCMCVAFCQPLLVDSPIQSRPASQWGWAPCCAKESVLHTERRIYVCIVDEAQASSELCYSPSILLVLM